MSSVFDDALQKISLELSVEETDYKHQFTEVNDRNNEDLKSSPYMIVSSDNDKIKGDTSLNVYKYGDGSAQDSTEQKTLECCPIPGVNKRLDMPEKATLSQAVRESTLR